MEHKAHISFCNHVGLGVGFNDFYNMLLETIDYRRSFRKDESEFCRMEEEVRLSLDHMKAWFDLPIKPDLSCVSVVSNRISSCPRPMVWCRYIRLFKEGRIHIQ